jgi:hypothetical protein
MLVVGAIATLLAFGIFAAVGLALLLRGATAVAEGYRRHLRPRVRLAARRAPATLPAVPVPDEPAAPGR